MISDLFVPTPPAGATTKQIANADFVATAFTNAGIPSPAVVWSSYTATLTAGAGSLTSVGTSAGRFTQIGKTVFCSIDVAITTNGTGSSFLIVTLPVVPNDIAVFFGREINVNQKSLSLMSRGGISTAAVRYYDSTYPGVDNGRYVLGGSYEVP